MNLFLPLIPILPILAGTFIALAGMRLPRRISSLVASGAVAGSFIASLCAFFPYRSPASLDLFRWLAAFDLEAPFSLYFDPLAAVMCLMVTFVSGIILVYSHAYMRGEGDYARFFSLMSLFVGSMLLLVLAGNLPLLFLGWEGVGFCSYGLIGFWYREEQNADAGRKAFLVTRIGDMAFGVAIFWLFSLCGTLSINEINGMAALLPAGVVTAVGFLLLGGAMGKSAQMPLMVWLPDAMAGPTPVSALIHAATMVTAGVYLLIRFFPLVGLSAEACAAIAVTGGITAFYAASCALVQRDLKRILAYSTMSQIGYMMLGVGCGALTAATFHLLVHSFYKSLLFLGAGCVISALHHEQDIFRMGGRAEKPSRRLLAVPCRGGLPGGSSPYRGVFQQGWYPGGGLCTGRIPLRQSLLSCSRHRLADGGVYFPDGVRGFPRRRASRSGHQPINGKGAHPPGTPRPVRRTDQSARISGHGQLARHIFSAPHSGWSLKPFPCAGTCPAGAGRCYCPGRSGLCPPPLRRRQMAQQAGVHCAEACGFSAKRLVLRCPLPNPVRAPL
jgi:NADH-quinone oxidoreductase subunit L